MSGATDKKIQAQRRGRRAEHLAAFWLRFKGYRILAHGARLPGGEIDLIAKKSRLLVFVEVKYRRDLDQAAHAITHNQQRRIQRAAEAFVAGRHDLADHDMRFDVVFVRPWAWPVHLVDAWRP